MLICHTVMGEACVPTVETTFGECKQTALSSSTQKAKLHEKMKDLSPAVSCVQSREINKEL